MADPRVIWQLVHELIVNGGTAEEVCREHPELVEEVRKQLHRVRAVEEQVDTLFPSSDATHPYRGKTGLDLELPQVPGYEIQAVLGYGGMGVVYRARHLALDRPVALKMVLAGAFASAPERQRLLREAKAVAALRHPNIVTVYDVGESAGRPYFTMELVDGDNLAQRLAGTPQPARDAGAMVATLADAVHAAHQAGIIHRDLKPANVLVAPGGGPKITDFGLARHFEGDAPLTFTGVQVGTPSYMAPEQASGRTEALGPGVDIYSLGALLYEMLTGRPPFRGETALETQRQVVEDEPAAPSRLNSKVPRDLETICLKCLEKAAPRRYRTAQDLADDLNRYLRGDPIAARRAGPLERAVKWVRRYPSRAVALAGSALVVLSLAGPMLWVGWQRAATARAVDDDLRLVSDSQRSSDWVGARTALERAKGRLGTWGAMHLRERIRQAEDDLALVATLDSIQLNRATFSGTGVAMADAQASREYRAVFQQVGLWDGVALAPAAAAEKVRRSNVRDAILGALDEWSMCEPDLGEELLQVGRLVDPDPWRSLVRDPAAQEDRAKLEELAAHAPVDAQPVRLLVALSRRLRAVGADAAPLLRRVQRVHADDLWANFELGSALIDSAPAEAVSYLRAAVAIRPGAAPVHYNLGQALRGTRQFDEAINAYQCVLRITPGHRWSLVNIGVCLHHKGELTEAIEWYRQALELEPDDVITRSNLGISLQSLGRLDDAIVELQRAIKTNPGVALLHNNLGAALMEAEDSAGAIAAYEQAVRLDPRHGLAHLNLGRLLRAAGRLPEASVHFSTAAEMEPSNFAARSDLRGVLIRLGEHDRVRSEWQRELAGKPVDHEAWNGYAELCLFLGSPSDYHQVCGSLLAQFGTTTDPYIAERTGRTCLLLPASADVIRSATILVDVALSADKARYADWALPFFHFARGLAEYRQGRCDAAIATIEAKASTVLGPAPRLVIAMAQHDLGRSAEARSTLAAAMTSFDWRRPNADISDAWMYHILRREAEAAIVPNLPAFLEGTYLPQDNDERLALTGVCEFQSLHHLTARLYADVFEADPSLAESRQNGYRYRAACAAVAAGNVGSDRVLDHKDRAMWRAVARQWLRDELAAWNDAASGSIRQREVAQQHLVGWRTAADLTSLRDPEELTRLPEAERSECRELWAEVDTAVRALRVRP